MNYDIIGDFIYAIIIIATLFILMELQGLFLLLFKKAANSVEIQNEDIIFKMPFNNTKTYRINNIMSIDIIKLHEIWHFPLKVSFYNGDIIRLELVDVKGFVKLLNQLNPRIDVGKKVSKITLW